MSTNNEIKGKVVDPQGKPVVNAVVLIKEGPGTHQDIAILSNDDGLFYLLDLASGDYVLVINKEGYFSKSVDVNTRDTASNRLVVKLEEGEE